MVKWARPNIFTGDLPARVQNCIFYIILIFHLAENRILMNFVFRIIVKVVQIILHPKFIKL